MSDRTVHACQPGMEIVRYDRAGKWWLEYDNGAREQLTLREAVYLATRKGSTIFLGRPGGQAFDRKVRDGVLERWA